MCAYAVLAVISNCYPPVWGRFPTRYSPVRRSVTEINPKKSFRASLDLHVLSTPPAFILSQDQTLNENCMLSVSAYHLFSDLSKIVSDANVCLPLLLFFRNLRDLCSYMILIDLSTNRQYS